METVVQMLRWLLRCGLDSRDVGYIVKRSRGSRALSITHADFANGTGWIARANTLPVSACVAVSASWHACRLGCISHCHRRPCCLRGCTRFVYEVQRIGRLGGGGRRWRRGWCILCTRGRRNEHEGEHRGENSAEVHWANKSIRVTICQCWRRLCVCRLRCARTCSTGDDAAGKTQL